MSALTLSPIDILQQILCRLNGTNLVQLWLTGDRRLHHTLGTRGALSVATFKLPSNDCGPSRLPAMLKFCQRLTILKIDAPRVRIAHAWRMWDVLSSLTMLRKLKLRCHNADEWMFDFNQDLSTFFVEFPDPTDPNPPQPAKILTGPTLRPISATFPHLESLHLGSEMTFFEPEHIRLLPKSLTCFKLQDSYHGDKFDQECLPYFLELPNLRKLSLKVDGLRYEIAGVLPSTVTHLTLSNASIEIPKEFWGEDCHVTRFIGNVVEESSVQSFPPSLVELNFSCSSFKLPASFLRYNHLPHLEVLTFSSGPHSRPPPEAFLPAFPPTLTMLKLDSIDDHSALPPLNRLKTLHIGRMTDIRIFESIRNFRALTSLFITLAEVGIPTEFMSDLPPGLLEIYLSVSSWSPQLQHYHLDVNPIASLLPRGLKMMYLSVPSFTITPAAFKDLPRHLEVLSITVIFEGPPGDDSQIERDFLDLPRTLKKLIVAHTVSSGRKTMPPHYVKRTQKDTCWTANMLNNLPKRSLTSFSLIYALGTVWTAELMKGFGDSSLTELTICGGQLLESAVQYIPRGLTSLSINAGSEDTLTFPSKRLIDLPRNLTALTSDMQPDSEINLLELPPRLKALYMKTEKCLKDAHNLPFSIADVSYPLASKLNSFKTRIMNEPLQDPCKRTRWLD